MSLPAIVRLRNYRDYPVVAEGSNIRLAWADWKAPQDQVFVAVILGTEPKDGSDPFPILTALRDLVIDGQDVVPQQVEATQ